MADLTDDQVEQLIHEYAQDSVDNMDIDNMDMDAMYTSIYEHITERMSNMTQAEVLHEIEDLNPDVLATFKEEQQENQRRDEKNGLYPDKEDIAN